ncbi:MAG: helix-turn-helix domain-containing protein [Puniceicoccaceae bacterium]|nr:MAG: helix-turn-helix domain-containing protein [Puniceicoccaceae bacterium]
MPKHLFADRDIQPEDKTNNLQLSNSGEGATNIIRRFLSSANTNLPRSVIQDELLSGLKQIFGSDGNFTEIATFEHDYDKADYPNHAQIIHVMHDGHAATASKVSAHFDKIGLVAELGAKPSDLLQANGIIWVEGPSDRIYINQWIGLLSDNELQEGRDYQCAYFGGALLARTEVKPAEEEIAEENRINLLRVNPNIYLVCDGDRDGPETPLEDRVQRLWEEVTKVPDVGFWATQGRVIENYVPGEIIGKVREAQNLPDPGQCERFFGSKRSKISYLQDHQNIRTLDLALPLKELSEDSKKYKWVVWSKGFDGQWLADFTSAAKIRKTNKRLTILSNPNRPSEIGEEELKRFFFSVGSPERESRILNAFISHISGSGEFSVEVISGNLERLSVPVSKVPALKQLKASELEDFELDTDGSWIYWPSKDIHLGWEQLQQILDPKMALKAKARAEDFNRSYGQAVKQLRMEKGLRQTDIAGFSSRQVSRIENGDSPVNVKVLETLAKAHGMTTNAYMDAAAKLAG